jgi:N-acetylglucosamine-6-phosphate deacetylase
MPPVSILPDNPTSPIPESAMELLAKRYHDGRPVRLQIADGKIARLTSAAIADTPPEDLPWIAPGLFDIQTNGYMGQEFSAADLTPERVLDIVKAYDAHGVTRCCPTLTTQPLEVLEHSLNTIDSACNSIPDVARRVAGIHLEAPYLTPQDGARGAHPLESCRRPKFDEFQRFQEAAGGRIRILTMSVEFDESPAFVEQVRATGVIVAIGHTSATPEQIVRAVDAGARLSTHLGNGSHRMIHRHRNYIWPQLADDRLVASIIVDGHHLPPAVVKTFVRAKTAGRCILISDMSGLAGLGPGLHSSKMGDLEMLPDGKLVVAGQREILAGASCPLGTGVANIIQFADVDLATAVKMATYNPSALLGMEQGGLEVGDPADLVVFNLVEPSHAGGMAAFRVKTTILGGEQVWHATDQPE